MFEFDKANINKIQVRAEELAILIKQNFAQK